MLPPPHAEPRPQLQPAPFDEAAAPDPHQALLAHRHLADAGHARAQVGHLGFGHGLDAEQVAPTLGVGHRGDQRDLEGNRPVGQRGEHQLAPLPDLQVGDVALGHLQHDAVGVERRDLEQALALAHRGAQLLGEIAADDQPGEGRAHLGLGHHGFGQPALGLGLLALGAGDLDLGEVALGLGVVGLLVVLVLLARPAGGFELQLPVVQRGEGVALLHHLPGAGLGRGDEAVKGRDDQPTHPAFESRVATDPEIAGGEHRKQQRRQHREAAQLEGRVARAEQPVHQPPPGIASAPVERALLAALGDEGVAEDGRQRAGEHLGLRVDARILRPLESEHAVLERLPAALPRRHGERHRQDQPVAVVAGEGGVIAAHQAVGFRCVLVVAQADRLALVGGFGHRRFQRVGQIELAGKVGGVG